MQNWELDRRRFAEEVLVPARDHWDPAENWFRFCQLPLDTDDPALIRRALDTVRIRLNRLQLGGVHAETAKYLATRIDEATAVLLDPTRREAHRRTVREALRALGERVRAELGDMPAVPAWVIERITRSSGHPTEGDVRGLLIELGIAEREPAELDVPSVTGPFQLTSALRLLRFSSLGEYLRSPERQLGADPTDRALDEWRAVVNSRLGGDELTAEERIITALRRWRSEGQLRDVLRQDAVEALSRTAARGREPLEAELRRPGFRTYLADLGLPDVDELAYAVLCRTRFPKGGASARWQKDVDHAFAHRDLRMAMALLDARADLPPALARRRAELTDELAEIDRQLAEARQLEESDPEAAAARYAAVLGRCLDPEAEAGLRRCRPAPPRSARADTEGDVVRIEWAASTARTGTITYTVARRDGTPVATGTPDLVALDGTPPSGVALVYTVTTLRDGIPGEAATTQPVTVLRRVTDLDLVPGDGVVEIRWTLPDGALDARVTRIEEGASGSETVVGDARSGLRDDTARTGSTYEYRVSARYRVGDSTSYAEPVNGRARPQAPPKPVGDLHAERDGDGVVLSWTDPPDGVVRILLLTSEPREPAGRTLSRSALDGFGAEVRGRPVGTGLHIQAPPPGHRYWFLPVTVVDDLATLGTAVRYDVRLPAVTDLSATAQGPHVRLSWTWPPGTAEARVYRRQDAPITGPGDPAAEVVRRVTQAGYDRAGCHVPAPAGECWFGVGLVALDGGEELAGPVEQRAVTGPRELTYEIRPVPGLGRRWDRLVELHAERGTIPAVQIRARADLPPLRQNDGEELTRFPAPGPDATSLRGEFRVVPEGRTVHLRAFALDAPDVVLVPSHPDQLRVGTRGRRRRPRPRPVRQRGTRCPHCWEPVDAKALLRRCPERCTDSGKAAEFFPRTAPTCPHGAEPATAGYCPHCHKRIEHDYITTRSRVFATIGSSDSGKSTWIGVLVKGLRDRGREFGSMATELVGDASKERYRAVFEKALFEEGLTLRRTDSVRASQRLEPLLVMTRRPRNGSVWRPDRLLVGMNVFYDTAGEDILRRTSMDPLARYLDGADAIIFVLDPLQVPSVRATVGGVPLPDAASNQVDMLVRTAELLRERRGLHTGDRIATPLAVVVTKTDSLPGLIPAGSAIGRPGPRVGAYDEADGQQVNDEVRALLAEWFEGERLLNVVDGAFSDHRFFAVSALGTPPATSTELAAGGIHPLRAEDPMLWLLARFGLVPVRRPRR